MKALDYTLTGTLTFDEFQNFVGLTGGSKKLFAERRRRISEEAGFCNCSDVDPEEQKIALKEAGYHVLGVLARYDKRCVCFLTAQYDMTCKPQLRLRYNAVL